MEEEEETGSQYFLSGYFFLKKMSFAKYFLWVMRLAINVRKKISTIAIAVVVHEAQYFLCGSVK